MSEIVLVKDLIGKTPVRIDQRNRNADGSLKYPEQQRRPRMTTLINVWIVKRDGVDWLYWSWEPHPETYCHQSGVALNSAHTEDEALEVFR